MLEVGRHHHRPRPGREAGLHERARAELVEVEERISDLETIRDNLRAALDAGCAHLVECARIDGCPIPCESISARPTGTTAAR